MPQIKDDQNNHQSPDRHELCLDGQLSQYDHHNRDVDNHDERDQRGQPDQYGQQDERKLSDPRDQVPKLDTLYEDQATPLSHNVQDMGSKALFGIGEEVSIKALKEMILLISCMLLLLLQVPSREGEYPTPHTSGNITVQMCL